MSVDLLPGWLGRQMEKLSRPYTEAEFDALNLFNVPGIARLMATVQDLRASLATERAARESAERTLAEKGFRRCDMAACNCAGWHGGHSAQRLCEIGDALVDAGIDLNGRAILEGVRSLRAARDTAESSLAAMREAVEKEPHAPNCDFKLGAHKFTQLSDYFCFRGECSICANKENHIRHKGSPVPCNCFKSRILSAPPSGEAPLTPAELVSETGDKPEVVRFVRCPVMPPFDPNTTKIPEDA